MLVVSTQTILAPFLSMSVMLHLSTLAFSGGACGLTYIGSGRATMWQEHG